MSEALLASVRAAAGSNDDTVSRDTMAAEVAKARADGVAAGKAEGAKAERERCSAILGSEAAKGRESLAQYFAFKTEMPADAAVGALDAAPKAAAEPEKNLASRLKAEVPRTAGAGAAGSGADSQQPRAFPSSAEIYQRRAAASAR